MASQMIKLIACFFCIMFSFGCLAKVDLNKQSPTILSLSQCGDMGCLFSVIPASINGDRIWLQSRLPIKKENNGKLNSVFLCYERNGVLALRVPVRGYVSQTSGTHYISEFEVDKKMLKDVFITAMYGAEKEGHEETFKIVGLEALLNK